MYLSKGNILLYTSPIQHVTEIISNCPESVAKSVKYACIKTSKGFATISTVLPVFDS